MRFHDRLGLAVVGAALLFVVLLGLAAQNYDFRAFYCAGAAAREGADPYKTQPLSSCERRETRSILEWKTNGVRPAPFPGYVIGGIFEPLSLLPYRIAARLWTIMLIFVLVASALLLHVATKRSLSLVSAALCLSVGVASLGFGEIVPLFLVFLSLTMVLLQRRAWTAAALCCAGCLIEPHLGVPVCIAVALWAPRTRVALVLCAIALAGLSIAALGVPATIEYFTRVLPYHALSEIGTDRQFALSSVLYSLGVSAAWALRAGSWSYMLLVLAGVLAARRLTERFDDPAYLAAVPAAVSLAGGVFLHVTQMVAAIPLALLLLRDVPQHRWALSLALAFLAIPFVWIDNGVLAAMAAFVAVAIAFEGIGRSVLGRIAGALIPIGAVAVVLATAPQHVSVPPPPRAVPVQIDSHYPQYEWASKNLLFLSSNMPSTWVRRAPTWIGLFTLLGVTSLAIARKRALPNILTKTHYEIMGSISDV